jgi:methyl-accepting chemotaxis protein
MRVTIQAKLIAAFGVVLVLTGVLGLVAVSRVGSVYRVATAVGRDGVASETSVATIGQAMNKFRKDQIHYMVVSPASRADVRDDLSGDQADMAAAFKDYAGTTPQQLAAFHGFEKSWKAYVAAGAPLFSLVDGGHGVQAQTLIADGGAADTLWDPVKASIARMQTTTTSSVDAELGRANATYGSAQRIVWGLVALAGVLGLAIAILISRQLSRGIREIVRSANAIAEGDVQHEPAVSSRDEIGELADSFRRMLAYLAESAEVAGRIARGDLTVRPEPRSDHDLLGTAHAEMADSLRQIVGDVRGTAGSLSTASRSMAATSDEAGRAVGEIAQAVSDVAAGADRQARMAESTRASTEATESSVQKALELARQGTAAAAEADGAMTAMRASSAAVTHAINELVERSEKIGGIVDTITGIAGQTNLLALNAAIEAARAGEQGRGFAVVAEEVRKLAEESQAAAATIAGLIAEIQTETEAAVAVVEDGAAKTEEGAAVVARAREAFEAIDAAVDGMQGQISEIVKSAAEVAAIAEESSASAQQVSASTEETSASTEQIAASAHDLAQTASELNGLVGVFKLAA